MERTANKRYGDGTVKAKNTGHEAPDYTGNGWAGDNYDRTMSTKDVAAEVRKQIRAKYPARDGFKVSVRYDSFAGGSAIRISLKAAPFKVYDPEYSKLYAEAQETRDWSKIEERQERLQAGVDNKYYQNRWSTQYTDEANEMLDWLRDLVESYRHSDSDGMIDYFNTNFYASVDVDWEMSKNA